MVVEFRATYDGKVIVPQQPLNLQPGVEYRFRVDNGAAPAAPADSPYILDQIAALATDMGVTDLAEHHNDYALGRRKLPETPDEPHGSVTDCGAAHEVSGPQEPAHFVRGSTG
jgi:hypothetical protein